MSRHHSQQPYESKTELEVVIDRRMIGVGAATALLLVVVPAVGFLCLRRPKSEPEAQPVIAEATRAVPASRADAPRVRFDPASVASLEPPPLTGKSPEPVRVRKAVTKSRPQEIATVVRKAEPAAPAATATDEASAPQPSPRRFKRLHHDYYDSQLLRSLGDVPEFDLPKELRSRLLAAGTARKADKSGKGADKEPVEVKHALLDFAAELADLQAFPLRQAKDCQKQKESAQVMRALSSYFRNFDSEVARRRPVSLSDQLNEDAEYVNLLQKSNLSQMVKDSARRLSELQKDFKWDGKIGSEELAVLVQMLQVKGKPVRMELVKMLDACREAPAGVSLAQRAIFDMDNDVRESAVAALSKRPRSQYREVLLAGLRHPWPPVAAHAAEAISELRDLEAAPQLADLLDRPDPCAPQFNAASRWVVNEMVSINHLRNCVLCHAASQDKADPGRSPVPEPGSPLPTVYYESIRGNAVRTDITYLRQDFSVMQFVEKRDKWPSMQRFDYVVRTRELTLEESARHLKEREGSDPSNYPQRSAVLFALREITGEDAGNSSADWRLLLNRIGLERKKE
jgi:hypothetical protein